MNSTEEGVKGSWLRLLVIKKLLLGSCFLVTAVLLYFGWTIWHYPSQINMIPNAPLAIVLGASTQEGKPTPVFQGRIEAAIHLYKIKKIQKILFTGGPGEPSQALVAKQVAIDRGVPGEVILVETRSKNTLENLRFAQEMLPENAKEGILIVSDPLHLMRAMFFADRLGLKAYPAPVKKTRYQSLANRLKFLLREVSAYGYYRLLD
ncbi:MAG: YdcF family protein, partial [Nitrospirales bacterium]|nr:YdcF family protein [Nitrospirales bacterium]